MNGLEPAVMEGAGRGVAVLSAGVRCAIDWAPEVAHPLWAAGCVWLGRDPRSWGAQASTLETRRRFVGDRGPWVDRPARHGFHASLTAPARLRAECTPEDWVQFVAGLAARHRSFDLPSLQVGWLNGAIALIPVSEPAPTGPLDRLVHDAQTLWASCRDPVCHAAPSAYSLTGFHLALSNRFEDPNSFEARALFRAATRAFEAALAEPLRCRSVCVFEEQNPGGLFLLRERLPLLHA